METEISKKNYNSENFSGKSTQKHSTDISDLHLFIVGSYFLQVSPTLISIRTRLHYVYTTRLNGLLATLVAGRKTLHKNILLLQNVGKFERLEMAG